MMPHTPNQKVHSPQRALRICTLLLVSLTVTVPPTLAQRPDPPFAILHLPDLGGGSTHAYGINDQGLITGGSVAAAADRLLPVIIDRQRIMEIERPRFARDTWGVRINNLGQVAMNYHMQTDLRAALWDPATRTSVDLGSFGGISTRVMGLNNSGQAVGRSSRPIRWYRAFLWQNGVMSDLGDLQPRESYVVASDINDEGLVVGYTEYALHLFTGLGAFIWESGQMRHVSSVPKFSVYAYSINNHKEVVGRGWLLDGNRSTSAIYWDAAGHTYILDSWIDPAADVEARHINDHGLIIGRTKSGDWKSRPLIWWDRFDIGHPLKEELPPNSHWILQTAEDLNNQNQIVGNGTYQGREDQGYLLTPVTPTFDLAEVTPGRSGVSNTITASNLTPGTRVYFVYGQHGGGTLIPNCTAQQNVLQIEDPRLAGSAIADANGAATLTGTIPPGLGGHTLLFQAVVPDDCAISNLIEQTIDP